MTNSKFLKRTRFLFIAFIDISLFIAVFFLMNYVQHLLESDAKINLTEIVTQNKDVITSKLSLEMNTINLVSDQLSERYSQQNGADQDTLRSIFLQYAQEKNEDRLFLGLEDGVAVFPDASSLDISGRHYFRLAMEGTQNISERMVSRKDGEDVFSISVPIVVKEKTIGTIQKQYTLQEMYEICSVSLFSDQGSMYIINSQGYVVICSHQELYGIESDNYYRALYLSNPEQSKKLEEDIRNHQAGFMEIELEGSRVFSGYTPIDEVYDWYLISSVTTNAVSPNANIVIRMFYIILFAVVLVFGVSMIYYLHLKNKQQSHLEKIAFVDSVTQGSTSTKFRLDLQEIFLENNKKNYYIFTFDIDNFKYINSCYGFDTGDRMLKNIYNIFAEKLHPNERIARVYSDHFVVLLEDASEDRLNSLFNSEFEVDGIEVYISAGLYPVLDCTESVSLMVDKANMAAQRIKGMRYKRVEIYSIESDRQMMEDEQVKRGVEQALADDEIIPYFQPKVDVNSHALVGAEALARWHTKDGKLVSPGVFIPVCEKTGLITLVDFAIYEKTLQFIRRSLDAGVECVPISVNFSRMHLLNKDFMAVLLSKLKKYNVPPQLIELELTETVIFDNYQMITDFINQLHSNGFQVSMDDFGSGFSSLHMLKEVDIDVLKIDRGFLQASANSERQKAVFAAIAQMANRLKMRVVVEGVETVENIDMMREFGCTIAQGFYFSRPIPEKEFDTLYQEGFLK